MEEVDFDNAVLVRCTSGNLARITVSNPKTKVFVEYRPDVYEQVGMDKPFLLKYGYEIILPEMFQAIIEDMSTEEEVANQVQGGTNAICGDN